MDSFFEHDITEPYPSFGDRLWQRLKKAVWPIIPPLVLDAVDFFSFGPIGVYFGLILGCPVGYWVCSCYRMPMWKRLLGALFAGLYCMLPFTEWLPAATLIAFYARFWADE
ncbi:hypothetical protein U14_02572 [Candidatus Moduliflexus flocculans]|uniref:Uncharacterized protein n=1 Tax=Candidatus Moduliflexus flocculans TaxID=1499966 RepID=A0A081BLR3_9BACT|nr:hypothetical protein U14_02572 [Candidatus Moduliflexus flocculans]